MKDIIDIDHWKKVLERFVDDRDWRSFHNVKNLSMNLMNESSELMEIFTWKNQDELDKISSDPKANAYIRHEMGDVMMTLIMIADEMKINLSDALAEKLDLTAKKYPVIKN